MSLPDNLYFKGAVIYEPSQERLDQAKPSPETPDWKTSTPRKIELNVQIDAACADYLKSCGVEVRGRNWSQNVTTNERRVAEGEAAGVEMHGKGHRNAAGHYVVDNGISQTITGLEGAKGVTLDRIWYDLVHRLGMTFTGCHVQHQQNEEWKYGNKVPVDRYKLKLRFETNRDGHPVYDFFEGYVRDGVQFYNGAAGAGKLNGRTPERAANEDLSDLQAELRSVQLRIYQNLIFWRNPNRSWTLNAGPVYQGKLEFFTRVRIPTPTEVETVKIQTPKYRQNPIAPRKRVVRRETAKA